MRQQTEQKKSDTKQRILAVARALFAQKEYDAVSVREISTLAKVNVASVHYYFQSKENLYWDCMKSCYERCSQKMKTLLAEHENNIEEALVHYLHYCFQHSDDLRSHFMMLLTARENDVGQSMFQDSFWGPPGGEFLYGALACKFPSCPERYLCWASRAILGHIVHIVLVRTSLEKLSLFPPYFDIAEIEQGVKKIVAITFKELS